jgi:hypothetical protein
MKKNVFKIWQFIKSQLTLRVCNVLCQELSWQKSLWRFQANKISNHGISWHIHYRTRKIHTDQYRTMITVTILTKWQQATGMWANMILWSICERYPCHTASCKWPMPRYLSHTNQSLKSMYILYIFVNKPWSIWGKYPGYLSHMNRCVNWINKKKMINICTWDRVHMWGISRPYSKL